MRIKSQAYLSNDPPSVEDSRNPTENRQTDIDEEIGAAAGLQEDGERGEEEGEDVEADVARA